MEVKTIKEVLPEREALYPDAERIESAALMGKEFILKEATELDGEHGKFNVALVELEGKTYSLNPKSKAQMSNQIQNLNAESF